MTDTRTDRTDPVAELLRDLQTELAVEPSPAFAAGVRQRVAAAQARRRPFRWSWTFASAVAAGAVVVVAAGTWWWTSGPRVTPTDAKASRESAPPAVSAAPAMAPVPTAAAAPSAESRVTRRLPDARVSAVAAGGEAPKAAEISVFEVLVAPDQLRAVRHLMAAARDVRTGVPPGGVLIDEQTGELILPELKEIPPIVINPLPGSDDGRSGGSRDQ